MTGPTQLSPTLMAVRPMRTLSAAMTRSAAAARPMPLATATPCTWAITGLLSVEIVTRGCSMVSIHAWYSMGFSGQFIDINTGAERLAGPL